MNLTTKTGVSTPFGSVVNHQKQTQNQTQFPSQANSRTLGGSPMSGGLHPSETQPQSKKPQAAAQGQGQSHARVVNQGNSSTGVSSPGSAAPGGSNTKKGHGKHPSKSQSSSGTGTGGGTPFKTMELAPAARRKKKRKVSEKKIPDKVAALLPESALYTQLVELEAKVDAALSRKKTDIEESVKRPPCAQKTLRIYVFNTFSNQPNENIESKSSEPPSWTLKIIGSILEDGGASSSSSVVNGRSSYPKFSSFFKKMTIYLDQALYPDNHVILWENSRSPTLHEGFEIKRKGDKEFTAVIRLEMNYVPEKVKLSAALSQVLGVEVETRARIMTALWHYVRIKKLQDPSDTAFFSCDPPLRKVFGEEKVKFSVAAQKLTQHLSPLQPMHLEHKIKLSGNNPSGSVCYDVVVDVPFPLEKDMSAFLERMEKCSEIDDYDNDIAAAIKKIDEHRQRRTFFLGFSQSPAEFVSTLIASQDRDLKVVAGDAIRDAEKERRSEFFNQPWVEDAVIRYLNRKPGIGGDSVRTT